MYSRKTYRQPPPGYSGTAISPAETLPDVRFRAGAAGASARGASAAGASGQQNGRIYTQRIPVPPLPLEGELAGQPKVGQAAGQPAAEPQRSSPFAVINQNMTALRDTVGWLVGQLNAQESKEGEDSEKKEILQGKDLQGQTSAPAPAQVQSQDEAIPPTGEGDSAPEVPEVPEEAPEPPEAPAAPETPEIAIPRATREEARENPYLSAYYHRHPEARPTPEERAPENSTTRLTGGLSGGLFAPTAQSAPAAHAALPHVQAPAAKPHTPQVQAPNAGSRKLQEIFQEIEKRGLTSRELLLLGIGLLLST